MSPRKPASEELTKEMILKKARIEFINKGFQQVSMRAIAKQLQCSHGAIYYHYKNKAELFYAIVEEDFSTLNRLIEKTVKSNEDNSTKLFNLFIQYIEFGLNHQSQYEIMFMIRNTEVDSLSQQAATNSYQKFAQAVHNLANNNVTISDVWSAFIALHGFVAHYRGYVRCFDDAKLAAEAHVEFILKSLSKGEAV